MLFCRTLTNVAAPQRWWSGGNKFFFKKTWLRQQQTICFIKIKYVLIYLI